MSATLLTRRRIATLAAALALALACAPIARAGDPSPPKRIVSMAPSITETLFALGLGDCVVGVTAYCDYPPEAKNIAKVGGRMDPSYEQIVALQPDLVVLLDSHTDAAEQLRRVHVETLSVPHQTITDIHTAILRIGKACGAQQGATALVEKMKRSHARIEKAIGNRKRPRVLISIGRDTASGNLAGLFAAGRHSFYDEVIEAAGGVNAYADETVAYPQLSPESIIQLAPDVVIDLASFVKSREASVEEIADDWDALPTVPAVRNGRVHVIVGTYALRPGPRYVRFLEELAALLHPEAF